MINTLRHQPVIIFFWILLLLPTIFIAGAAFTLLRHEQERINRTSLAALEDRTTVIAEGIHTSLLQIQHGLTRSLSGIPPAQLKESLQQWESNNPLIRNVFIWQETRGLILPPKEAMTGEEHHFVTRYDTLFTGQLPWKTWSTSTPGKNEHDRTVLGLLPPPDLKQNATETDTAWGWIPWFSENRLCILGWVEKLNVPFHAAPTVAAPPINTINAVNTIDSLNTRPVNPLTNKPPMGQTPNIVYGVELELMTLISRLFTQLPQWQKPHAAYAIQNGNGELFYQSGPFPISPNVKAHALYPISPLLPHWRIGLYLDGNPIETHTSFMLLSGILLTIFIISILSSAALMTRQAQIHRRDAMQKTSFVASVSHELKTPLTSIRLYAELLQSGRVQSEEKKSRYYDIMVTESHRLSRLVNTILDFGRLEQGRKTYTPVDFDLDEFLNTLIKSHEIRLREAGMTANILAGQQPYPVHSDPDALEQIILNLVDNAVKYASKGKQIYFELTPHEKADIAVTKTPLINSRKNSGIRPPDGHPFEYILKIRDNGPGIPYAHKNKIFDKFHRVETAPTARQPGSGLGLSIARQMARDLGGDLYLDRTTKKGCTFTIKIVNIPIKHGNQRK